MLAVEKSNTNNIPSNEGKSAKRFNFVVKTDSCIYAIECNFYSGGGSKLNETARSYKMIALESKDIKRLKFVWFIDGIGWKSARKNLEETFDALDDVYSIDDLENGIIDMLSSFFILILNLNIHPHYYY